MIFSTPSLKSMRIDDAEKFAEERRCLAMPPVSILVATSASRR